MGAHCTTSAWYLKKIDSPAKVLAPSNKIFRLYVEGRSPRLLFATIGAGVRLLISAVDATDFPSQYELSCPHDYLRRGFYSGRGAVRRCGDQPFWLEHGRLHRASATDSIQSQTPRGRRRHRLPVLSYVG